MLRKMLDSLLEWLMSKVDRGEYVDIMQATLDDLEHSDNGKNHRKQKIKSQTEIEENKP